MASCQNETILPCHEGQGRATSSSRASGPVYEEAAKAFPGLAGESRSGDANGQWFRVLAAAGTNLVTLAPGMFATTACPILGANPPKQESRPPLRRDVACETQEPPDLRSKPGAPPEQHQVDTSDAAVQGALREGARVGRSTG